MLVSATQPENILENITPASVPKLPTVSRLLHPSNNNPKSVHTGKVVAGKVINPVQSLKAPPISVAALKSNDGNPVSDEHPRHALSRFTPALVSIAGKLVSPAQLNHVELKPVIPLVSISGKDTKPEQLSHGATSEVAALTSVSGNDARAVQFTHA